jgi:hypothetical protein
MASRLPVDRLPVDQAQRVTGSPAASTALLERGSGPLLGLLQWGGGWDASARCLDGLPWLGQLADTEGPKDDADSAAVLLVSWSRWRDRLA